MIGESPPVTIVSAPLITVPFLSLFSIDSISLSGVTVPSRARVSLLTPVSDSDSLEFELSNLHPKDHHQELHQQQQQQQQLASFLIFTGCGSISLFTAR